MAFTVDHAKRMRAAFQKDGGKHAVQIGHQWTSTGADDRRHQLHQAGTDGQDHRHPRPHVPQHAARQAAVVAAGLSRHDAGEHHLEELPGRVQTGGFRRQPLHQLALLLGLLGRQRLREHVPPAFLLVQGHGPEDSARRHHDGRHLPVEGRPRSAGHHERHHGARRGDSVHLGLRLRQRSTARHRGRAGRQRHHLAHAADHQVLPAKGQPQRRQRNDRRDAQRPQGAHAELLRCHARRASSPTVRSKSASAFPSPAAWRWRATGRSAPSAGTR